MHVVIQTLFCDKSAHLVILVFEISYYEIQIPMHFNIIYLLKQ